eukprot:3478842-Rhodomonas_salina.1
MNADCRFQPTCQTVLRRRSLASVADDSQNGRACERTAGLEHRPLLLGGWGRAEGSALGIRPVTASQLAPALATRSQTHRAAALCSAALQTSGVWLAVPRLEVAARCLRQRRRSLLRCQPMLCPEPVMTPLLSPHWHFGKAGRGERRGFYLSPT